MHTFGTALVVMSGGSFEQLMTGQHTACRAWRSTMRVKLSCIAPLHAQDCCWPDASPLMAMVHASVEVEHGVYQNSMITPVLQQQQVLYAGMHAPLLRPLW